MMDTHIIKMMLGLGGLLLFSVFASKTSSKFGIPVLVIFIAIGMLSGTDGLLGIQFDDPQVMQVLGTVALIFILFSGGLSTQLAQVKPVWKESSLLATLGVVASTVIMASIIRFVLGWEWIPAALFSATISSTDAAAVFGILKTQKLGLKKRLQSVIELESGSNDPMAVFLTLSFIGMMSADSHSWWGFILSFIIEMSVGATLGWLFGKSMVKLINWLKLEFEGLYPVLTIAGVLAIYSATELAQGNGFLAVYLSGLAMGDGNFFSRKTLGVFHDGLAWLMQVAMFLALGLLVFPLEIPQVMPWGIFLSACLMLVARPLSVALCLAPFRYRFKEILFISWGGLRGAVPVILATYFLVEQVPDSRMMFNMVFFIVVSSMLIQGTTVSVMAKLLGVQEKYLQNRKLPFKSRHTHSEFIEFYIPAGSPVIEKSILQLKLPKDVLVVLIHRQGEEFIPRGNTQIQRADRLVCLSAKKSIPQVEAIFGSEHFFERKMG